MQMKAMLYYRSKLDSHDQKIYDDLVEKWMRFDSSINIGVPHCEFSRLTQAIHFDYPLLFYINYYRISYTKSLFGITIHGDYLYQKEEAKELLAFCEKWGEYILKNRPHAVGKLELALWLHDVILNNVKYSDENGMRAHNMIGVIKDGKAVCEGISMTYKFLCDFVDIPCAYVSGTLNNEPHGWNMIWINGEASFVDVTNDVSAHGGFDRKNFLRSSKEMVGYKWDQNLLPECRLANKSNQHLVAHNRRELRHLLNECNSWDSANIYLDFGYQLSKVEMEKIVSSLWLSNPLIITRKLSYSDERQMLFIQR